MKRPLARFVLAFLLFAVYADARQQSGTNTWARYRPGKLSNIIRAHSDPSDSHDKGMDLGSDPVRAHATYTGRSRPTSAAKQRFILFYMESLGTPEAAKKFGTEMLFVEGGAEFWLPVQDVLLPYFGKELHEGEGVTLFADWIGITYPAQEGSRLHVFLVNEFQKSEISESQREVTDEWGTLTGPDGDFKIDFPAEPKRDEFRGTSNMGTAGQLVRRYFVSTDQLMLALSFQDLGYAPNSPFSDRISPTYERKVKEAARKGGWKIVGIYRLSRSVIETETWEPSGTPDGYVHSISHTVIRNGQLYDLHCRSALIGRKVDRNICGRFFSSFRIIGPPR